MSAVRTVEDDVVDLPRGRSLDLEKTLAKYGVKWTFHPEVDTKEIDIDGGLKNQARFKPLHEDTAKLYQELAEGGANFPGALMHRPGRGTRPKLKAVDGNHRIVAYSRAGLKIPVYEISKDTSLKTIALLTHLFNGGHGERTTDDERVAAAMYLIDNGGKIEESAREMSAPIGKVRKAVAAQKARARADDVGLDPTVWDALTPYVQARVNTVTTDEGFEALAKLARDARFTSEEAEEQVQLLNTSRSGRKQRELVRHLGDEVFRERIQDGGAGVMTERGQRGQGPKPRARLAMLLGQITAMSDDFTTLAKAYSPEEKPVQARKLIEAAEKLIRAAGALDQSQTT